mmetsp:Transcript_32853/g.75600  ORF Transcript_32853/g.75600 Transcript_32853/m.75600 type:complete len:406 (-) Transcript_32853:62-1279(-)
MRLLLLPGPPKTASTHVQRFLSRNAVLFEQNGWLWPPCPNSEGYASFKGFTNLFTTLLGVDCDRGSCLNQADRCYKSYLRSSVHDIKLFYKNLLHNALHANQNVVIGSEYFVAAAENPAVFDGLREILPFNGSLASDDGEHGLEVVVNVRMPRISHLVSTYSQNSQGPYRESKFFGSFSQWLCKYYIDGRQSFIVDPLGLAKAFSERGANVTIIDMGGVRKEDIDVADALACDVMGMPCLDHKVIGVSPQRNRDNRKRSIIDTSFEDNEQLTNILEAMDCHYFDFFTKTRRENTKFMFQSDLFRNNCDKIKSMSQEEAYKMIGEIGCRVGGDGGLFGYDLGYVKDKFDQNVDGSTWNSRNQQLPSIYILNSSLHFYTFSLLSCILLYWISHRCKSKCLQVLDDYY